MVLRLRVKFQGDGGYGEMWWWVNFVGEVVSVWDGCVVDAFLGCVSVLVVVGCCVVLTR